MNILRKDLIPYEPFPQEILEHIQTDCRLLTTSRLGGIILEVMDKNSCSAILKIGKGTCAQDLLDEKKCLELIKGNFNAPNVLSFKQKNNCVYLLISKVDGVTGHMAHEIYSIDNIIKEYAKSLKEIHSFDFTKKTIPLALENILRNAEILVSKKKVKTEDFKKATNFIPNDMLKYLEKKMWKISEKSFTHGDYCLPNILIDRDKTSVIDWGQGAISNINRDFMSVELSIRMNFGDEYINKFYEYYGETRPDPELINYFWYCDQFEKYKMV